MNIKNTEVKIRSLNSTFVFFRILYLHYKYQFSIFSINILYKFYKTEFGEVKRDWIYNITKMLIKLELIKQEKSTKEILNRNGFNLRREPLFKRRLKRFREYYTLTEKGKRLIETILKDDELNTLIFTEF